MLNMWLQNIMYIPVGVIRYVHIPSVNKSVQYYRSYKGKYLSQSDTMAAILDVWLQTIMYKDTRIKDETLHNIHIPVCILL